MVWGFYVKSLALGGIDFRRARHNLRDTSRFLSDETNERTQKLNRNRSFPSRNFFSQKKFVNLFGCEISHDEILLCIQNQEKEDLISTQISMVEYYDPFEKWLKSNSVKKDKAKINKRLACVRETALCGA